jgi:hypothetical protein
MKLFIVFVFVSAMGLIIASLASGMELSISIGGNDGSSSMNVHYGAMFDDYNYEHIQLNPADNTLSNAFSGSGSLPSGSISISDTKGNYAQAYRSISGKSGTTKWNYDWNTYKPTSSAGSGVGAWVSLTASNAYSISGGSYASNGEGDNSQVNTNINSNSLTTSSLTNYYTYATAFTNAANAYQNANSATGSSISMGPVAKNNEGDQAWDTITVTSGSLRSYSDSASAALRSATTSQIINRASGSSIQVGPVAKNKEGDQAWGTIRSGSLSGYGGCSSVSSTSAATTQSSKSISGSSIQVGPVSMNLEGDQAWDTTVLQSGSLRGYSDSAHTSSKVASSAQRINSGSGSSIQAGSVAQNSESDISNTNTQISNGVLSGYSVTTAAAKTSTQTSPIINAATGSLIDLTSHAQDTKLANEYLSYSDGSTKSLPINYGGADFEVRATVLANTKLVTCATSNNVVITPTLPTSIKNAIMLEPFKYAFTYAGATNLGTTVFPDLVGKGYATLRYTDSGASSDKFGNLGQYNVVLVDSNMNSGAIGLSTINPNVNSNYMPASQLNYKTSKNRLVILAGSDSFDGYPKTKSALATAVSGAYLSGGYANTVSTNWNNDYLGYFFDALNAGQTASKANTYANNLAIKKYGSGQYNLPLVFYGNQLFKLRERSDRFR